jgi:hypothetical protein
MVMPTMASTTSPCWLSASTRRRTKPMGLLREGQVSSTSVRPLRVSPGRTGLSQRQESRPGEPVAAASSRWLASTPRRIRIAQVCQPLAMSPPKMDRRAASGSVWNGCGSYLRAKARISASVIVCEPSAMLSPALKSSQYFTRDLRGASGIGPGAPRTA